MQPLTFHGRVEKGEGFATNLGCPTANVAIEQGLIIPALGVYIGETSKNGSIFPCIVFINDGRDGAKLKMEVHLLDVCEDLFGKRLTVVLFEKIRDSIPFPGDEEMAVILKDDLDKCREWFKNREKLIEQSLIE